MKKLAGKNILITRPAHQSFSLIDAITEHGGHGLALPCIEIIELSTASLKKDRLFDLCIVTSVNAVQPRFYENLSQQKTILAIGPATAAALQTLNLDCITPPVYSSAGLLDLPLLQTIPGKKIALYTGENPNPTLHDTLQKRGAQVEQIFCYKRVCPHYCSAVLQRWRHTKIDYIITNSQDALCNLNTLFDTHHDWLTSHPLLVISAHLKKSAEQFGFKTIYQADNASTLAILDCLLAITP